MTPIDWPAGLPIRIVYWSEQAQPVTVRTPYDNSAVKVRRRFTGGPIIHVQCTMELRFDYVELLLQFFNVDCQGGVKPFWLVHPQSGDTVDYRMMEAPVSVNLGPLAASVGLKLEHLPYWG